MKIYTTKFSTCTLYACLQRIGGIPNKYLDMLATCVYDELKICIMRISELKIVHGSHVLQKLNYPVH